MADRRLSVFIRGLKFLHLTGRILPVDPAEKFHLPARKMGNYLRCHDFATTS